MRLPSRRSKSSSLPGGQRSTRSPSWRSASLPEFSRRRMISGDTDKVQQGYAKRFGAAYGDVFSGTFIGSAILPSLLKQDPRYFYKGTGSTRSRILYALANAVICKGDNKRWQPNYSGIIGSFATGGISYLYYPQAIAVQDLLVQNSLLRLAGSAVAGVFQEFVLRRLTPHLQAGDPRSDPALMHQSARRRPRLLLKATRARALASES